MGANKRVKKKNLIESGLGYLIHKSPLHIHGLNGNEREALTSKSK